MPKQTILHKTVSLKFKKEGYKLTAAVEQSSLNGHQNAGDTDDDCARDDTSSFLSLELVHIETGQKWDAHLQDSCTFYTALRHWLTETWLILCIIPHK